MGQQDPSRTEEATPKRRNKERKEGNVPKGAEMGKAMVTLAGLFTLRFLIPYYYKQFTEIFHWFFREGITLKLTTESVYDLFLWSIKKMAGMVLPLLIILAFVAYITLRLQVGSLWTTKVFKPKFAKMFNLVAGIQKLMLSPQAFIRLGKSLLQALAVAVAPYIVIKQEIPNLLPLFYQTPTGLAAYILQVGYRMACYAMIPMILIAIADLWYSRWNYEEKLKMTKDEVKDERKQAEGDPKIKQEQLKKMMMVMAQRMMADVPKADVVVTNPTHLAIALRYNPMEAPAPVVLAKGANKVAEKIKEIARENRIPIQENKPLAQALYKQVEIGEQIPEELFQAVAAILAGLSKYKQGR